MSKSKNIDTNTKLTREDMLTADVAAEKLQQLRELFPGAFGESVNDEGDTVPFVDWERIRAEIGLGTDAFFNRRERYGLDWPGKTECVKLIQQPSLATLMPCPEESVDFNTTENLFIEGDNLEVLKLLQKSYFGKVKMIYIDPPYNTGHDFVYPDNFAEPLENYLELTGQKDALGRKLSANAETAGRFHTNWLNMMFPRLYLARNLLREDGVIFISIDDNEIVNLRKLCDEIFGEENFVGCIIVKSNPRGSQSTSTLAQLHEYLLVYSRSTNSVAIAGHDLPPEMVAEYKYKDEKGAYRLLGLRQRGAGWRRQDRPNLFFPIYANPETGDVSSVQSNIYSHKIIPVQPSSGDEGRWRWSRDKVMNESTSLKAIKVVRGGEEAWDVYQRDYLSGDSTDRKKTKTKSIWDEKEVNYQNGTVMIKELIRSGVFEFAKPVYLVSQTIRMMLVDDNDIILDFFSGSATTAHAVLDLNKEDGGNRRFIMVQIPEPCDENSEAFKAGYKTIADIGKERIRRVGKKLRLEIEDLRSKNEDLGLLAGQDEAENLQSKIKNQKSAIPDLGFRVFKLDRSNFRVWDGSPGTTAEQLFERMAAMTDPLRDGTKPEDLLYELLLKAGFPLSTQVKKIKLAGKTVYSVEDDAVLLCLENEVTKALIDEVIKLDPVRFYCLDKAFKKNDQLKVNTIQQFAAHNQGRDKETEIVFRTI